MNPIDIHCHFFNRKELNVFMLLDIARMLLRAEIRLRESRRDVRGEREARHLSRGVRSALMFVVTSMLPPSRIFSKIKKSETGFLFCPLTLDLYGLTKKQEGDGGTMVNEDRLWNVLREEVEAMNRRWEKMGKERGMSLSQRRLTIEMHRMGGILKTLLSRRAIKSTWIGGKTPDAYNAQVADIERLTRKHPNEIFPFYSVDPRRESNFRRNEDGTYDLSPMTSKLRREGGVFVGFKLYTPLGYSPTNPLLMSLYAYCERHEVPIVAHVSGSGMTTLANELWVDGDVWNDGKVVEVNGVWKFREKGLLSRERVLEHCETLNHPMLWEKVLRSFPRLKIDLAHFGQLPGTMTWTNHIWRLMTEKDKEGNYVFRNLYVDLSNIIEEDMLTKIHDTYFANREELESRFLYGSDYYMNMIYERDMNAYVERFKRVFGEDGWQRIAVENPHRFLDLKDQ